MAQIQTGTGDKVYTIKEWLGVNENPDGDTGLKLGEASAMRNFKITNNKELQKRPGTLNIAGLLSAYSLDTAAGATTVATDLNAVSSAFTAYPDLVISSGGVLSLSGTSVTVNSTNISSYDDYYWTDGMGQFYQVGSLTYSAAAGTHVTGGAVSISGTAVTFYNGGALNVYPDLTVSNGAVSTSGTGVSTASSATAANKYCSMGGTIYKVSAVTYVPSGYYVMTDPGWPQGGVPPIYEWVDTSYYEWRGYAVTFAGNDTYIWAFYKVTATTTSTDTPVHGIWSGRVGATEYIAAACNGRLWSLSETGGIWTKAEIGAITTTGAKVHMFGFDSKLYIMNGSQYKVWDGTTLSTVAGYRPLIAVGRTYDGSTSALLQRINMLNGLRRVRFSPDGSHAAFTLPEQNIASVDYAKTVATDVALTISSSNLTAGTATLSATPAAGTSSIEIGYTVAATYRSQIEAMTLSELYNGQNDNRVFLYGDGSNKAFYSDLDYNGRPTAEYFPDLNVVHVGDSNTPMYDLLRHYNELIAFKDGSAHRIKYGQITLETGTLTAAFYVETINKGIGGSGYGQAQLVGNHPRSLDGRSIYEWIATTSSGGITSDQRNAQRISQKVEKTLREMNLPNAITFNDKINHEYFVADNGVAVVQNTENGAWYIYRNFPAVCMIVYKDELYFGTNDGYIRHVSRDYTHDIGNAIDCYWKSGAIDFGTIAYQKFSDRIWYELLQEDNAELYATFETEDNSSYAEFTLTSGDNPIKSKAKNYIWMKLILQSNTDNSTATVLKASIRVRTTSLRR